MDDEIFRIEMGGSGVDDVLDSVVEYSGGHGVCPVIPVPRSSVENGG